MQSTQTQFRGYWPWKNFPGDQYIKSILKSLDLRIELQVYNLLNTYMTQRTKDCQVSQN